MNIQNSENSISRNKSIVVFITQSPLVKKTFAGKLNELFSETVQEQLSTGITELAIFCKETCGINFDLQFEARSKSLSNKLLWSSFSGEGKFSQACKASSELFSNVVLFSTQNAEKTAAETAAQLALPVILLPSSEFDTGSFVEKVWASVEIPMLLVCCSAIELDAFLKNIPKLTGVVPTEALSEPFSPLFVFCGVESTAEHSMKKLQWTFDCGESIS